MTISPLAKQTANSKAIKAEEEGVKLATSPEHTRIATREQTRHEEAFRKIDEMFPNTTTRSISK